MKAIAFLFAILAVASAHAQDWAAKRLDASPRHREWVEVKNGDRKVQCYVAYPERKDKAPVVLVIHEIFGLSDWAMLLVDELAEHGCIAIAPDFLSGAGPNGGGTKALGSDATRAIGGLGPAQITGDLDAAFAYAKTIPSANGKISVAGFCWGGTQSFRYATNQPGLAAAYVFYGSGPTDPVEIAKIKAPVYGFYAENDNRIGATVPGSTEMMKAAGKTYVPVTYAEAGHGFMRAGDDPAGSEGNRKARAEAWKRWLDLIGKQ